MCVNTNLIALLTLFRKEMTRVFRIWPQTLLPSVITSTLYYMIFGSVIGRRIGNMDGVTYIEYIVPGLILMTIITNSYANVVSSFFGSKFQRNIEELLIAPISPTTMIWGYLSGGIARGLMVGLLVGAVSRFFVDITIHNVLGLIIISVLTAILFALAGLANGIFAQKFDDITIVPTFVLTPLIYLGGVFYSVDLLPEFWHNASHLNPIFYMVNGARYCFLGTSDIGFWNSILVLLSFCSVIYIVCEVLIRHGVGIKS